MSDDSEYWTPTEAAAYLRRRPATLRSWVRRGLLDVYHVAGDMVIEAARMNEEAAHKLE